MPAESETDTAATATQAAAEEAAAATVDTATEAAQKTVEATANTASDAVKKTANKAKAKAKQVKEKAAEKVKNAKEAVKATADEASEAAAGAVEKTKETATDAVEKTKETARAAADTVAAETSKAVEKTADQVEAASEAVAQEATEAVEAIEAMDEAAAEASAEEVADIAETVVDEAIVDAAEAMEEKEAAAEEATASVEVAEKAEEPNIAVPPQLIFVGGIAFLGLFLYYIASESAKWKRIAGSVLAVALTAVCVWIYTEQGMEKGIELQGGISMQIRIHPNDEGVVTSTAQEQAIDVLTTRLNSLGTGDVIIAAEGKDGIFLQIPGVGEEKLQEIIDVLKKVAKLEFSILHPQSFAAAQAVAAKMQVVPGYRALPYKTEFDDEGKPLPTQYGLVKIKSDMKGSYVSKAFYYAGPEGHAIGVNLDREGADIMGELSSENLQQPMAIILDDVILSSPVIQSRLTNQFSITGQFKQEEAISLSKALENPLENPISIEYSNFITPTMGEATIQQGITAGVAGLALTLLFILIYYRFAGILAMIGLGMCIAIIFGAMSLFGFVLTLPGIAGIILTIGVAIDANVLIYERLREELAAGKSLKGAINTAYEKAFSAIIDANITTLITAIVLYLFAAGTVKGFAITLIIGIFATLFSSLIVSRICFNWATETNFLKKLSFMNLIPEQHIDFLSKRKACLIGSIILLAASLILVPVLDPRGVELKGGDSITFQTGGQSKEAVLESLSDLELAAEPIVQVQNPVGAEGEFFLVRSPDNTADPILAELEKDLEIDITDATVSSVGSAIGKSMLTSSVIALLVGMVVILIYVTIRFEFAFALGAIAALIHDIIIVIGVTTLLGQEVTLITIGAFLTIAGYSINDTIVVFDRVREGLATKRGNVKDIINYALNKTLSRTLLTSITTLITVIVLFIFGGPGLRNFAETLIVGVLVGTYSSIFIASPIVLWWARRSGTNLRRAVLDTEQSKIDALGGQQA